MSNDSHFEFYDLWENAAIYSLVYGKNGFSTKNSYRNNRWELLSLKNAYMSLSGAIFQFFDLTILCFVAISLIWIPFR